MERKTYERGKKVLYVLFSIFCIGWLVLGIHGNLNVTYQFDLEVGGNLMNAKYSSSPEMSIEYIDKIIDHGMFYQQKTPLGWIAAFRPTPDNTLERQYKLLQYVRERLEFVNNLYISPENFELNRLTIPGSEIERIEDAWSNISYEDIRTAWIYQNVRWYFWIGGFQFFMLAFITGIATFLWWVYWDW